jgi:hypothetical protein
MYVADTGNHKIRKITSSGVTTVVGTGSSGSSGDNGLAASALLNLPYGIDIDTLGNLYIADTYNARIRFVNIYTNIITTIVASYVPQYIDVDNYGNFYFTDINADKL